MRFPKKPTLPKSLWRSRKVTEKEAREIQRLFNSGYSKKFLARKFKVSVRTITRWVMSDEERYQYNQKNYLKYHKGKRTSLDKGYVEREQRRKLVAGEKLKEFYRLAGKFRRAKHPEQEKARARRFRANNPRYWKDWLKKHPGYYQQRKTKIATNPTTV